MLDAPQPRRQPAPVPGRRRRLAGRRADRGPAVFPHLRHDAARQRGPPHGPDRRDDAALRLRAVPRAAPGATRSTRPSSSRRSSSRSPSTRSWTRYDLSSLKRIVSGAAPLCDVARRGRRRPPRLRGEAGLRHDRDEPRHALRPGDDRGRAWTKYGSVGPVVPGVDAKLLDPETGREDGPASAASCASAARTSWRATSTTPRRRAAPSTTTAGSTPATSPRSTPRATSRSSTASRSSSSTKATRCRRPSSRRSSSRTTPSPTPP